MKVLYRKIITWLLIAIAAVSGVYQAAQLTESDVLTRKEVFVQVFSGYQKLQYLVVHCSATPSGKHFTGDDIKRWHLSSPPYGRGWSKVGYSDLILLDGTVENLVWYNNNNIVESWEISNGVKGINSVSRHVCYVGGICSKKACDSRTKEQINALTDYIHRVIQIHPDILIAGHYHFAAKACPSFNVEKWCRQIGIPEKNIYRK